MKKITLIAITLVIGLAACAKHRHAKKQKQGGKIISVTMQHTACFGSCPVYKLELNRDGTLIYTGIRFTEDSGVYFKNIGRDKTAEMLGKFSEFRIDTCKDEYDNRIPDLPGLIYTIKYKDRTKKIMNAHYGPPILAQLRVMMDQLVDKKLDESWKKLPAAQK